MTYWDEYDDEADDGGWAETRYGGSRHDDDWEDEPDDDGGGGDDGRGSPRWLELLVAVVAAVAVVVLIVKLTDDGDGDSDEVATEEEDSTTSSSRRTTTTRPSTSSSSTSLGEDPGSSVPTIGGSSTTRAGGSGAGGGGGGSATTRRPTTTQSTNPVYEDVEQRCTEVTSGAVTEPGTSWEAAWETRPAPNDPAELSVCVDDWTPRVGQRVSVYLVATDADAEFAPGCVIVTFEVAHANQCGDTLGVGDDPPNPTPSQRPGYVRPPAFTHTFDASGSFTVYSTARSGTAGPFLNPYASIVGATLQVQVHG